MIGVVCYGSHCGGGDRLLDNHYVSGKIYAKGNWKDTSWSLDPIYTIKCGWTVFHFSQCKVGQNTDYCREIQTLLFIVSGRNFVYVCVRVCSKYIYILKFQNSFKFINQNAEIQYKEFPYIPHSSFTVVNITIYKPYPAYAITSHSHMLDTINYSQLCLPSLIQLTSIPPTHPSY